MLTAAGFHIEQSNVLVSVPNTGYSVQSGLVHSDGFEFEAHAEPFRNLMLTAAVSVQKVKDDATGKPLIQSGKGNASLFAFYTMPSGSLKGLGVGGGMRYSAKVYGGEATYGSVWLPQYALFDASVSYDLSNLSHSLRGGRRQQVCVTSLTGIISPTALPMGLMDNTVITENAATHRPA